MNHEIGTLYYAVMAYEADRIDHTNNDEVDEFFHEHLDRLWHSPNSAFEEHTRIMRPEVAAVLSRTQNVVNHFTAGFVSDAAPRCPEVLDMAKPTEWRQCSDREIFRIQRALYRYQTYCNLFFRSVEDLAAHVHFTWQLDPSVLDTRKRFLATHYPWENEQLASILDYLERVLSRAFDTVAAHDIAWGYYRVDWTARGSSNRQKQTYLSRGLLYLHRLDVTDDYFSWYKILTEEGYSTEDAYSPLRTAFTAPSVMHSLYDSSHLAAHNLAPDEELTIKKMRQFWQSIGPASIFDNTRSDPATIWFLLHRKEDPSKWIANDLHELARRAGYVMWDAPSRHPADAHFERRLKVACRQYKTLQNQADRAAEEAQAESWKLRQRAYLLGHRGGFVAEMHESSTEASSARS
ncbi:hypothetical protein PWT90_01906 [Aphanocladium album]|nr:hypothetical protein PWT90_01906 [Aphanocladium album]